jgi:hypothetical protein
LKPRAINGSKRNLYSVAREDEVVKLGGQGIIVDLNYDFVFVGHFAPN